MTTADLLAVAAAIASVIAACVSLYYMRRSLRAQRMLRLPGPEFDRAYEKEFGVHRYKPSTCLSCGQDMTDRVPCRPAVWLMPMGTVPVIPHEGSADCHDCWTPRGAPHHPGCDAERCPHGQQAISCDDCEALGWTRTEFGPMPSPKAPENPALWRFPPGDREPLPGVDLSGWGGRADWIDEVRWHLDDKTGEWVMESVEHPFR